MAGTVQLTCDGPQCEKKFTRLLSTVQRSIEDGIDIAFCSRQCCARFHAAARHRRKARVESQ